jgi:hypothetical protein
MLQDASQSRVGTSKVSFRLLPSGRPERGPHLVNSEDPFQFLYIVFGVLLFIGSLMWRYFVSPKRKFEGISRSLERLGFVYLRDRLDALPADLKKHPFLPQLDVSLGMTAVWKGSLNGIESTLIWKSCDVKREGTLVAVCFPVSLPFYPPEFRLIPVFNVFGDLKKGESFSNNYWFSPPDDRLRNILQKPEIVKFFERDVGWYLHYSEKWLVVYRYFPDEIEAEDVRRFIGEASEVLRILNDA